MQALSGGQCHLVTTGSSARHALPPLQPPGSLVLCDRTPLRKQKFISQDHIRVVLSEVKMLETQQKAYNTMMFML
jgi:hypothetical protein